MTKYFAATGFESDGDADGVVPVVDVVRVVVVFVFVVVADAGRATNTPAVNPSELTTSIIAATPTALRLGASLLTTYLPCRSPVPPGSRSLPGAGRGGLRSHCGL